MNQILFSGNLSHQTLAGAHRAMVVASFALLLLGAPPPLSAHRCTLRSHGTPSGQKPSGRRSKPLTFKNLAMGEMSDRAVTDLGLKTEGQSEVRLGFTAYLASDGVRLSAKQGKFASPSDAERYFDLVVGRSGKVLKRGKMNDGGKVVGRRAEVVLKEKSSGITEYGLLWTSGSWFQEIDSTSLQDNLALLDGAIRDRAATPR